MRRPAEALKYFRDAPTLEAPRLRNYDALEPFEEYIFVCLYTRATVTAIRIATEAAPLTYGALRNRLWRFLSVSSVSRYGITSKLQEDLLFVFLTLA